MLCETSDLDNNTEPNCDPNARKRSRRWLGGLTILLLLVIYRGSQVEGWLRPVIVVGPSMTPTLWGPHYAFHCAGCGIPTRVVASAQGRPMRWTCVNCGHAQEFPRVEVQEGDRVLLDRGAYWFRTPARDELVAIQDRHGQLRVKRVVGLPGDGLRLREGDLWIQGQLFRRSLEQVQSRLILVHDDRYRNGKNPPRWTAVDDAISETMANGYCCSLSPDWSYLRYAHYSPYGTTEGWQPAWVTDDNPANQHLSHRLFPSVDLVVSGEVTCEQACQLRVGIWTPGGTCFGDFAIPRGMKSPWAFAWVDGQAWLSVGRERPRLQGSALQKCDLTTRETPILLGCQGQGKCFWSDLQVRRDLYLQGPRGCETDCEFPRLGEDSYFLLGDNAVLSEDDRCREEGTSRQEIVGRVFP